MYCNPKEYFRRVAELKYLELHVNHVLLVFYFFLDFFVFTYLKKSLRLFTVSIITKKMVSTGVKCGGMVSILIVLAAYFYKQQSEDILNDQLENILLGLERAEQQVGVESDKPKVAVGFGACQDVVTSATSLLYNLGAQAPETPEYVDDIVTQENFEKVFAYFFRHGAAAE